jgi:hypothetical protein
MNKYRYAFSFSFFALSSVSSQLEGSMTFLCNRWYFRWIDVNYHKKASNIDISSDFNYCTNNKWSEFDRRWTTSIENRYKWIEWRRKICSIEFSFELNSWSNNLYQHETSIVVSSSFTFWIRLTVWHLCIENSLSRLIFIYWYLHVHRLINRDCRSNTSITYSNM